MTKFVFVGTSHISPDSVREIEARIKKEKPDLVAVELDPVRYEVMVRKNVGKHTWKNYLSIDGLLLKILTDVQNDLSKKTGIMPGSEMLRAVQLAKNNKIKVVLIDQDIRLTVSNFRKIPLKEKMKIIYHIFFGLTSKTVQIDISKVPEKKIVDKTLILLKKEFPNLYKILVQERDLFMARFLMSLKGKYKKIFVVVGMGHAESLKRYLSQEKKIPTRY